MSDNNSAAAWLGETILHSLPAKITSMFVPSCPVLGIKLSAPFAAKGFCPPRRLAGPSYRVTIICLYFLSCPLNLSCSCCLYFGNMTVLGAARSTSSELCLQTRDFLFFIPSNLFQMWTDHLPSLEPETRGSRPRPFLMSGTLFPFRFIRLSPTQL